MKQFILISFLVIKITATVHEENNLEKRISTRDRSENCFEILDKKLITNTAGSLLLHQARGVYNLLKDNPTQRNRELLEYILSNKNLNRVQISKLFKIDDSEISVELFQEKVDFASKDYIENFLEKYPLIRDRLDELSLFLSDFLSLDNKGLDVDGSDALFEIKRILYRSIENIPENFTGLYASFAEDVITDLKCNGSKVLEDNTNNQEANISNITTTDTDVRLWDASPGQIPNYTDTYIEHDGLNFYEIPKGDELGIYKIVPENDFVLFSLLARMLSFLQPDEFPLGLLIDALGNKMPIHLLILQIIKLEGLVLCWILFWGILALCLPFAVIAQMCCTGKGLQRLRDDTSCASSTLNNSCIHRVLGLLLYILMFGLICSILLMLAANDKFSRTVEKLPATSKMVLKDAEIFVKNTHLQLKYITSTSFELTMKEVAKDMKDIDKLLGKPFQEELASLTGLDRTIQELKLLKSGSAGISGRVTDVIRECNGTQVAGKALQDTLQEVSKQLNLAKRYCHEKDRSLCESLQTAGLNLAINIAEVTENPTLRYLEQINRDNNFNATIDQTLNFYENIPKYIGDEAKLQKAEIDEVLQRHRREIYSSLGSLEEVSRSITARLRENSGDILAVVEEAAARDLWRYLAVLASSLLLFLIWTSLVCGSPCGCHYITKSIPFLKIAIVLICISSLIIWIVGSVTLIFGGHGTTVICNPLYQDHFTVLSSILDEDGLLYEEGFIKYILKSNQSLKIEDVLRSCEKDQTAYSTFHLENRIDINKILNYQSWNDLKEILDSFAIDTRKIRLKSEDLDNILHKYGSVSTQKIHELRSILSMPITFKDLKTFLDQIHDVARQISNSRSAASFETIWLKLKEIINEEYKIVVNHRDSLLFKLTSLQILLTPVHERTERLMANLADAEGILQDKGAQIAEKNIKRFIFRFERNLNELQRHVNEQLRRKVGKCKPIWDLYDFSRHHLCQMVIDPLNCLALSYFLTIAILLALTPLILNLIHFYSNTNLSIEPRRSRRYEDSLSDQEVWNTPPERPPLNGILNSRRDVSIESSEEIVWTSPRPSIVPAIPSPPIMPAIANTTHPSPRITPSINSKPLLKVFDKPPQRSSRSPRGWL